MTTGGGKAPVEDIASNLNWNSSRRRQGSQNRLLHHLESESNKKWTQKFNKKRPQDEERQPGRHIASDVSRNSISNCHRRKHGSHDKPLPCIFIGIQKETTRGSKAA